MTSTNGTPPTRQQALSRIEKLEEEIQKIEALITERDLLKSYVAILNRIAPVPGQLPPEDQSSATAPPKLASSVNSTADTAYELLKHSGPLNLSDLLKRVRENKGWKSSGDDKKDRDRLWQAMRRDPKRFMRVADHKWAAK